MTTAILPTQGVATRSLAVNSISLEPALTPSEYPVGRLRFFTVAEYHKMIEQGFFARDEGYELLEGMIVHKMSRDPIHDAALEMVDAVLRSRVPVGWRVRVQSAITTDGSEPEPDLTIVRGRLTDHIERHPSPDELALVVEVANTSLANDRSVKGRIYAKAGIAVYWIVNLIDFRVEVYSDPSGPDSAPAYRRREDFPIGRSISLSIGGAPVAPMPVAELLPPTVPPNPAASQS